MSFPDHNKSHTFLTYSNSDQAARGAGEPDHGPAESTLSGIWKFTKLSGLGNLGGSRSDWQEKTRIRPPRKKRTPNSQVRVPNFENFKITSFDFFCDLLWLSYISVTNLGMSHLCCKLFESEVIWPRSEVNMLGYSAIHPVRAPPED